jgi:hypothetical protein
MRRRLGMLSLASVVLLFVTGSGGITSAGQGTLNRIVTGQLQPAVLHVNGVTKRLPFFSGGIIASAQEGRLPAAAAAAVRSAAPAPADVPGAGTDSLGCAGRAGGANVRVNQDCTYRRQAEQDLAFNPTDPDNLVAGMNDSLIGWNQTSLDFSLDGGKHWGAISTAPFRYRLNAPETLGRTRTDPNRHTLKGDTGTLHSYDACSDPYVAFDADGRAFYTCVAFDIASLANLLFVTPSPVGAKGSEFDQVPPPFGLAAPFYSGREHIVAEDNNPAASYDGPKVAADAYDDSPNRDNVYSTFTVFDFTCGATHDQYCSSRIFASMSTDHGVTWSTPQAISSAKRGICELGNSVDPSVSPASCNFNGHSDVAVLADGDLGITFANQNTPGLNWQILALHCHPTGSSVDGTADLGCGRPSKAADMLFANAPRCDFGGECSPGAYIRTPPETAQRIAVDERSGDLYLTWYDYRNGEYDVFESMSSDGGMTWTGPAMVNPDTGVDHYMSAIDVGEKNGGSVLAISYFRTDRVPNEDATPPGGFALGQPGVGQELSDYGLASGTHGSTPFAFGALSPRFPPADGIQAGFNGDYTAVVVTPDLRAHPLWSDTRVRSPQPDFDKVTVDEDVYTDTVTLR